MALDTIDLDAPITSVQLLIELVPSTSWGDNLRSRVPREDWDRIRKQTYRQAGYICEICGDKGPEWPVEAHEVWGYNDQTRVQKLVRTIALCPACHEVKHFGRTQRLEGPDAVQRMMGHLCRVNRWSPSQARDHVKEAFQVWQQRSQETWSLDLSWLDIKGAKDLKEDRR